MLLLAAIGCIIVSGIIWLPTTLAALSAAAAAQQAPPPDEEGEGDAVASLAAAGSSGVLWLLAGWGLITLFPVRTGQARIAPSEAAARGLTSGMSARCAQAIKMLEITIHMAPARQANAQ